MEKNNPPPPYGWSNGNNLQPPPAAPPSYSQAVGGVGPSSPYTPQYGPMYHLPSSDYILFESVMEEVLKETSSGPAIVTTVVLVGPQPTHMICPSCHAEMNTDTQTKPGVEAYIFGTIIFLLGGFLGCCLIPCCIDSCMDVHHTCPNCGAYLGRYRR